MRNYIINCDICVTKKDNMKIDLINIDIAIKLLQEENVVAVPTETVYGLGGRSDSPLAVDRIYEIKNRPRSKPLIKHFYSLDFAFRNLEGIPEYAYKLGEKFWPGPLTLVLNDSDSTVAVRVPSNKIFLKILENFPLGISAPSANKYSKVTPTSLEHVLEDYKDDPREGLISGILDGGNTQIGLESTIISCLEDEPIILRYGSISKKQIDNLGFDIKYYKDISSDFKVISSGMDIKHYSPNVNVIPVKNIEDVFEFQNCAVIGVNIKSLEVNNNFNFIKSYKDSDEMAHMLFDDFRKVDSMGLEILYVVLPIGDGIEKAIEDRVLRAASMEDIKGA